MEWTHHTESQLIKEIKERQSIWNVGIPMYHRWDLKAKAFNGVAEKLGPAYTGAAVKAKWSNLRSLYKREIRKVEASKRSGCSPDDIYLPKWAHFEALQFLPANCKHVQGVSKLDMKAEVTKPGDRLSDMGSSETGSSSTSTASSSACTVSSTASPAALAGTTEKRKAVETSASDVNNQLLRAVAERLSGQQPTRKCYKFGTVSVRGQRRLFRIRSVFLVKKPPFSKHSAQPQACGQRSPPCQDQKGNLCSQSEESATKGVQWQQTNGSFSLNARVQNQPPRHLLPGNSSCTVPDNCVNSYTCEELKKKEEPSTFSKSRVQYGSSGQSSNGRTHSVGTQKCPQIWSRGTQAPCTEESPDDPNQLPKANNNEGREHRPQRGCCSGATCSHDEDVPDSEIYQSNFSTGKATTLKRIFIKRRCFQCKACSKEFNTQSRLVEHLQTVHKDLRKWKCVTCGYAFRHRVQLLRHHVVHTGERPWKCDVCLKSFTQNSYLSIHFKTVHLKESKWKCSTCGYAFGYKSDLLKHEVVHTKEKPWKCHVCSKGFARKGALNFHLKTDHL